MRVYNGSARSRISRSALSMLSARLRAAPGLTCRDPWMGGDGRRAGGLEDAPGLRHLVGRAMSDHEEPVGLERRLVLHDAVLGNANAVQRGAQCTETTNH